MSFSQVSIKNFFFLFFITLIQPYSFCEAMNDFFSPDEENSSPTTPLLCDDSDDVHTLRSVAKRRSDSVVTKSNSNASEKSQSLPPPSSEDNSQYGAISLLEDSSEEDEPPGAPASSVVKRRHSSHQQDLNFSQTIPILNINPNQPERKSITRLLDSLKDNPGNGHLRREGISYVTALVVYDLSKITRPACLDDEEKDVTAPPPAWTDTAYFLEQLDKKFFNHPVSKIRIVLIALGAIEGGLAPWGISPLVMYLGENVLSFIPVGGLASEGLVYTVIGIATIPCMQQIGELMNDIGKTIFDKTGFTPSKNDKGPHIQNTDFEIETGYKRCCKYINIRTTPLSMILSLTTAFFRALPMGLLWWEAETPFSGEAETPFAEYRNAFIGPLVVFYAAKAFKESMQACETFAHQRATEPLHMLKEKKRILRERIKTLERCLNAKDSDRLVIKVYALIQEELRKKNLPMEGDSKEHISAFSALLIKLAQSSTFQRIQDELAAHLNSDESLRPVVEEIGSLQVPGMEKLITDIDHEKGVTGARALLENLSTFVHGAATPGRFFSTSWAVTKVLMYMGVVEDSALYVSLGAAAIDVVLRAMTEWYVQKDTFLSLRDVGSTKMPFWPAWWVTNTLSLVNSTFFSIPSIAILFNVMSDCPVYVRAVVAMATLPSEFASFYRFFHGQYGRFINNIAMLRVKTTSQKRAWLNVHTESAEKFIRDADQDTTEGVYHLTQGGL